MTNNIKLPTLKEGLDHLKKNGGHFENKKGLVKYVQDEKQEIPTAEELVFEGSKQIFKEGYCECGKFIRVIQGNFADYQGRYEKGVCDHCGKIHKRRLI